MPSLTPPRNGIPIAFVMINGRQYEAQTNPEWMRYLTNGLFDRAGGVNGPSTVEASQEAGGNAGTEEARAAIIELRSDVDQFASHGRIAASEENIAALSEIDAFALLAQVAALSEQVAALAGRINEFEQGPSL